MVDLNILLPLALLLLYAALMREAIRAAGKVKQAGEEADNG